MKERPQCASVQTEASQEIADCGWEKKKRYHPPDPDSVKMLRLKLTRTLEMPQSHISPFSKGIDILQLLNYN